ncbi:MAG: Cysteine desulfurase [Clostridiales bacterium 38_11]|nr:MAG: Cysteine desulfurase [Clostridiales bacterium 38_11]
MIYLDNAATSRIHPDALEKMNEIYNKFYGNPSSLHSFGHECEKILENSRERIASFINATRSEIVFTSGGTESNTMAILGHLASAYPGSQILTTRIEHPSVLETLGHLPNKCLEVVFVKTDEYGNVDIEDLDQKINDKTALTIFTHVNSELGSIQNLKKISDTIRHRKRDVRIHIDCVQSLGKIRIDAKEINADTMSLSGHKVHGPRGIGGLFVNRATKIQPVFWGGHQEMGMRSGTEDLPSIAGFAVAIDIRKKMILHEFDRINNLKRMMVEMLLNGIENLRINSGEESSPYILNISIRGIRGEILVHFLERDQIYISTGSACSSKSASKNNVISRVLDDEGLVEGTIRISFGMFNSENEIIQTAEKIIAYTKEIKKIARGR